MQILTSLSDVPAAEWDARVPAGAAPLLHAFLSPCDRVLDEAQWRVFRTAEAASPGLLHRLDLVDLVPPAARPALTAIRRVRAQAFRPRVLELGPPCCPGAAFLGTPAEAILDAAWARPEAEALIVRDFAGPLQAIEQRLETRGFVMVQRPTFVLSLPDSLDAYLAALRSSYRRRAEQTLATPLQVTVTDDFAAQAETLAHLFGLNAARAQESRRERIDAQVVRAWAACRKARAVLIHAGGQLVLAALVLQDPPVFHFLRVGFDAEVGRTTGAYFRLLYELVRFACAQGCRFLDLGLTSADAKLRLGAQPVQLRVWMRHRSGALQGLLRAASARLGRPPTFEARHVFRRPPPPITPWWYAPGTAGG